MYQVLQSNMLNVYLQRKVRNKNTGGGGTCRVCFSGQFFSNFSFKICMNGCCIYQRYICRVISDTRVDSTDTFVTKTKIIYKKSPFYCTLCRSDKVSFNVQLATKCTYISCDDDTFPQVTLYSWYITRYIDC